jgi:hypothetical protein
VWPAPSLACRRIRIYAQLGGLKARDITEADTRKV